MATPFGHSLAGWAAYNVLRPEKEHDPLRLVLLSVFMANAPDMDFLPGLLARRPALFHQGITHSVGIALVASLGAAWLFRVRGAQFYRVFNLCFISYLSHLLIDFFGPDKRLPYGIPVFWPVSQEYAISRVPFFWGVHHAGVTSASTLEWISGIFDLTTSGQSVWRLSA
jgi:inner membrane protein